MPNKSVPLLFVLMSRRKKTTTKKSAQAATRDPPLSPAVQQVTLDLERAVWAALRDVIPHARLHGWVFH